MADTWKHLEKRYNIKYFITDTVLVSYKKAGRTWLRAILAHILDSVGYDVKQWEMIFCCHYPPDKLVDLFGKNIRVLFLYRDPRDMTVSFYHERHDRQKRYKGTITDFMHSKKYGIDKAVSFLNQWGMYLPKQDHLAISYEEMQEDAMATLKAVLSFLGIDGCKEITLQAALDYASFNNMKRMEGDREVTLLHNYKGTFEKYAPMGQNTYRVRSGKVGGYKDELLVDDIKYVDNSCQKLLPMYNRYLQ